MLNRWLVIAAINLIATFAVDADIIPNLLSGPTPIGGGQFEYDYSATVTVGERLDPGATDSNTCAGATLCVPPGTFFTIYDIGGLVSASTTASGWDSSTQPTGVTPNGISLTDDPALENVTFTYSGPVASSGAMFDTFKILSTSDLPTTGVFSNQATNDTAGLNGTTLVALGTVEVPGTPASAVAEPPYVAAFLGLGVLGFVLLRKHATRR